MATAKEREEFIGRMVAEFCPRHSMGSIVEAARALLRHARTHHRLAEEECNGPTGCWYQANAQRMDDWQAGLEKRQERVEKRISEICAGLDLPVHFGGDPRGYTVKLKLLGGAYNTWGGSEEGYGVPQ